MTVTVTVTILRGNASQNTSDYRPKADAFSAVYILQYSSVFSLVRMRFISYLLHGDLYETKMPIYDFYSQSGGAEHGIYP